MINLMKKWLNPNIRAEYLEHFGWKQLFYDFFTTLLDDIVLIALWILASPFILIKLAALGVVAAINGGQVLVENLPYPHTWKKRASFKLEIIKQKEDQEDRFVQGEERTKREKALND